MAASSTKNLLSNKAPDAELKFTRNTYMRLNKGRPRIHYSLSYHKTIQIWKEGNNYKNGDIVCTDPTVVCFIQNPLQHSIKYIIYHNMQRDQTLTGKKFVE